MVQINAESLLDWKKRGKLIRMFRKGQAEVLGSDCHGIHRADSQTCQKAGKCSEKKSWDTNFWNRWMHREADCFALEGE